MSQVPFDSSGVFVGGRWQRGAGGVAARMAAVRSHTSTVTSSAPNAASLEELRSRFRAWMTQRRPG